MKDYGIAGTVLGRLAAPVTRSVNRWSIAIYSGSSPFDLSPVRDIKNPVLTYKDVQDLPAKFVADPFMIREGKTWHLFFEVLNGDNNFGEIALATSQDGLQWTYKQVVLSGNFHLSYPYVFKHRDKFYMIPETYMTNSVRLYEAAQFPAKWRHVGDLAEGRPFVDSSVVFFGNKWWMFTSTTECNELYLYYSRELHGPWIEHPMSPVVSKNPRIARPAGRLLMLEGRLYRFAQDDHGSYGNQIHAFEVLTLTEGEYEEKQVQGPVLKASGNERDWNGLAMHHIDAHQVSDGKWIACVDGKGTYFELELMKPLHIARGWL